MLTGVMSSTSPRRVAAYVAAVTCVVGLLIAIVLLDRSDGAGHRPARASSRPPSAGSPVHSIPASSSPRPLASRAASPAPGALVLLPLPRTDDPQAYARDVADALFDVDTAAVTRGEFLGFWQGEMPTVVYADAAAKGLTLPAQNADAIDNLTRWWIPTQAAWDSEAADHTTSGVRITSVSVPDYWVNAVADGTLRDPGLRMERVMGVLTQAYGADPAHRYSSARSVVIDLGLLCGPTQAGGCRLVAPQQPPGLGDS